jgi:hypothetical protein
MAKPRRGVKSQPAGRKKTGALPAKPKAATDEAALWAAQAPTASAALTFWNSFLILRMGPANDKPLNAGALQRLTAIIRAVSWVESKHGTATTNQGGRDPMQCGHPQDAWWKQVISVGGPGQDRFITGPGGSNHWAGDLPEVAEARSGFPSAARVTGLANQALGHDDPAFNPSLSHHWGVPFLIHKINTTAGAQTFKCGDLSRDRLIDGAVAYNGGGDPQYRAKIVEALTLSGGLPIGAQPKGRRAAQGPAPAVGDVLATIAAVMARATTSRRPARVTTATIRFVASHLHGAWYAAPVVAAEGEGTIEVSFTAPFSAEAVDAEGVDAVAEAIAGLLDELGTAAAPTIFSIELPLALGWRDGWITIGLAATATATHTLTLAVERRAGR